MNVVHIVLNQFRNDTRVEKEIHSIADLGETDSVTVVALWEPGLPEAALLGPACSVTRVKLFSRRLPKDIVSQSVKLIEFMVRSLRLMRPLRPRVVQAHDLSALPIAIMSKWLFGARIVYDAHELETETHSMRGFRKHLARFLERFLIYKADLVVVVSESIADWYRVNYPGIEPILVRNVPVGRTLPETRASGRLRAALGIDPEAVLFLYQGLVSEARGIRRLLEVFAELPWANFVVMGDGPLASEVEAHATRHPNIHHLPAVPNAELHLYTMDADVGLCIGDSPNLSYRFSLPNKLFEYVMAGVPAVVLDRPDKRNFIEATGAGWVVPMEVPALRDALARIGESDRSAARAAARRAASGLDWNIEVRPLLDGYRRLHGTIQ